MADALLAAIETSYRAAREAWPDVVVTEARFGEELRRRVVPLDAAVIGGLCEKDLYLAIACFDGDPVAVGHLERDYFVEAEIAARKLRASDDQAAEMRGHLRKLLFTADPERRSALDGYTGRGDLRGYLRVICTRELIRVVNKARKELPLDAMFDRLDVERSPELSLLRQRHGAEITIAIRAALERLTERDRALLRYSIVDGWTVDRIGEVYKIHRATAARWVAAARDALGEAIRTEVAARLVIDKLEVDSLIALVRSRIDISLARVL